MRSIEYKKNQKGFTLIELLLVVSLLAISVGVTNDILISLIRTNNKTQVMNEIEQQSNFLSLKMEKELRNSRAVNIPEADGSGGNTILNFTTRDGDIIEYKLVDGVIKRNEIDVTSNASPGGVYAECSGDLGNCFSVSGPSPQVVNISIDFRQAQPGVGNSFTGKVGIKSTIVIRNTY